jgi:hypothetical protein
MHPWEYLYPKDSNRRKLLHRDFLAGKVQPIYYYEMPVHEQVSEEEALRN